MKEMLKKYIDIDCNIKSTGIGSLTYGVWFTFNVWKAMIYTYMR